jgi:hypothetical protein
MADALLVMYRLTADQAESVNRRRDHAQRNQHEIVHGHHGYQAHVGNSVSPGEAFPMLIVRTWEKVGDIQYVNGQVFLDGNDTLWVTSVRAGTEFGQYATAAEIEAAEKAAAAKAKAAQDAADKAAAAEASKAKAEHEAADKAAVAQQKADDKAEASKGHTQARTRS